MFRFIWISWLSDGSSFSHSNLCMSALRIKMYGSRFVDLFARRAGAWFIAKNARSFTNYRKNIIYFVALLTTINFLNKFKLSFCTMISESRTKMTEYELCVEIAFINWIHRMTSRTNVGHRNIIWMVGCVCIIGFFCLMRHLLSLLILYYFTDYYKNYEVGKDLSMKNTIQTNQEFRCLDLSDGFNVQPTIQDLEHLVNETNSPNNETYRSNEVCCSQSNFWETQKIQYKWNFFPDHRISNSTNWAKYRRWNTKGFNFIAGYNIHVYVFIRYDFGS